MLWYRDFQFEWMERGCKRTLEHRTQPVTFRYWDEAQKQANRVGRMVTVFELRPCRWNNTTRRKRLFRVRPTTNLRFMTVADPAKLRSSDATRRRKHRAAETGGQIRLWRQL